MLAESLARQTSRYVLGAWQVLVPARLSLAEVVDQENLDKEVLERWIKYLSVPQKEHPFLDDWKRLLAHRGSIDEAQRVASNLQQTVLALVAEKKEVDGANRPRLEHLQNYKDKGDRLLPNAFVTSEDYCPQCAISLKTIAREKFVLWTDLFAGTTDKNDPTRPSEGVLQLTGDKLQRFLVSEQKDQIAALTQELEDAKKALPARYPYLHGIAEASLPRNLRMHLRGSPYNLGEEVPRGFIRVLSETERLRFTKGSGRLELAEAVASHPLAARVMVNRVWKHHFGRGIVNTPSNFGQLGERPSNPELLEYLAYQFRQTGYSLKTLHREIMLSTSYQLSSDFSAKNHAIDPDNRLHWRANRRRLDVEALRDSFLFVSGRLDLTVGGPSMDLNDGLNARRTVYAKIGRFKLNNLLTLFDFPEPSISSEQRNVTNVPVQGLFFMNSPLVYMQANQLAKRLSVEDSSSDSLRINTAYRLLFGRDATEAEVSVGEKFLRENEASGSDSVSAWQLYAQVLLSSNEFLFVN
ncbi:MAG: DUF1553 domain-containing protein [Acidobacteria bacterium]|nr:DUF1553 domain-containing protein [Acidobacteriota bacterium]MCI0721945.1 DUF1553 domain-containing protein [Acidobacteriota bacterium]